MRKCEVLLRQSIRERRSSLGTGACGSCSSSMFKAWAAFLHVSDPVAALSPDDSVAPAGAVNMEVAITDAERTDLIQGPVVFQGAGLSSNRQPGQAAEGMGTGAILHRFPWDPKPALPSCPCTGAEWVQCQVKSTSSNALESCCLWFCRVCWNGTSFCFTQAAAEHRGTGNHFSRYPGQLWFCPGPYDHRWFPYRKCPFFLLCSLTKILNSMYFLIYIQGKYPKLDIAGLGAHHGLEAGPMRVSVLLLPVTAELNELFGVIKPENLFHGPNSKPFLPCLWSRVIITSLQIIP